MPKLKKQTDLCPADSALLHSQNALGNLSSEERTPTSFPPHKKVSCFQCSKEFYIKFVIPRQEYSQKNDWEYWTGVKGVKSKAKRKSVIVVY